MPIDPRELRTGGALQSAVAASLVRQRETASELAPGALIGLYRVLREIGRGGMAIVYLAERADGEYEQQVALKWMQAAQVDPAGEALFRRERQALADLRHPHIARLLDGGCTSEDRLWFAMEFIDGAPLDRHCVERNLPLAQRLALFQQVCAAVAFAHARGMLHRDLKPSNVLVDADGSAKLLDFGIAQLLGQDDALALRAFTPGFASPEQLRGEPLTVASDIYQLGRLLASLLSSDAGERERLALGEAERITTALGADAALASAVHPSLPVGAPADLIAILGKACAATPAQRYATAEALAADLGAFLECRPVAARRRSRVYIAQRYVQRHPLAVGLGAAALALVIGGTTYFTGRLREERDIAQQQRDVAQRERDAAEEARAGSEAINRFLNDDLLSAANPLQRAPNAPETTVRQALDQAEPRVEQRLADEPAIATGLLSTLGVLRQEFGEYDHAKRLYERALQSASALPQAHPERLRARALSAGLRISAQDFTAGIAEFEALVQIGTRAFGPDDARVLDWELRLLEARSRQGADTAYRDKFEALAQRADGALGRPNSIAGQARLYVAQGMRMGGALEAGAPIAQRAHEDLAATMGIDHPSTLKALAVLAHGLQAQGQDERAVEAAKQAYELQHARFGPHVVDTLFLQGEYGFVLSAVDRFEAAEPVFADLVVKRAALWGEGAIQVVPPLSNLANARMRLGRHEEALADFERAISILDALPAPPATIEVIVLRGKADALRELERHREAASVLDAADALAAALPESDLRRYALQGSRARLLIATGERERGIAMLEAAIAAMREQVKDTNPMLKPLLAVRRELDAS